MRGGVWDIEVNRENIEDLRTVRDTSALYIQGKGRKEKTDYVKLPAPVEQGIRDYLKTRETITTGTPLFTSTSNNSAGGRLTTRSISGTVKTRLKEVGFNSDKLTAHCLRHTAVTLASLGGQSLQEAQQFAKHTNIDTTQIYAHNLDRAGNKCEETIARAIFKNLMAENSAAIKKGGR